MLLVQARQRHAAELAQLNTEHETAVKAAREAAEGRLQSAMLDAEASYNAALEEKKREIQTRVEAEEKQLEEALKAGWEKRKETLDAEGRARALQEAEDEERALKAAHQQRLDDLKDELERQLREFTQVGVALCLSRSRSRSRLSLSSAAGPLRVLRSRFFAPPPPTPHAKDASAAFLALSLAVAGSRCLAACAEALCLHQLTAVSWCLHRCEGCCQARAMERREPLLSLSSLSLSSQPRPGLRLGDGARCMCAVDVCVW